MNPYIIDKEKTMTHPATTDRRPSTATTHAEGPLGTPVDIRVTHSLDDSPNGSFEFRRDSDPSAVTVHLDGNLEIDWDGMPVGEAVVLRFRLDPTPDRPRLDGFSLGLAGTSLPTAWRRLSYEIAAQTSPERILEVRIDRSEMNDGVGWLQLIYHLSVIYDDGSSYVIDPKICNTGDGLGDGCA